MKKKTLNEEINRIIVLMESPNTWVTLGKALVRTLEQLPNLSNPVRKLFGDLANAADDETAIKILIDLANKEKRFFDQILPIFKKNMKNADQINFEMEDIVDSMKKRLDDGESMEEVTKSMDDRLNNPYLQWQSEGVKQMFRKDILDEISSYAPKKTIPTPPPVPPGATVKEVESLYDLIERVNKLEAGTISIKDRALLVKNFPFRESRAKINRFVNEHIIKGKYLEEKIAGLLKQAADDLKKGKDEVNPLIYKTISAEIEAYRASENVLMDRVYQNLQEALTVGLGGTTKAAQDAATIIQKIKEHDALNPNAPSYLDDLMANTYLGKIANWRKASFMTNFINFGYRATAFVLTGQLRTLSEFIGEFLMNKSSKVKKAGVIWFYFTAMTKIFVPAVFGLFQTLWNGIKMSNPLEEKEGALWEQYSALMVEKLKESFIAFDEDVTKEGAKILNPLNPDEQIDELGTFLKTLNPFEYYLDDLLDFGDDVAGGYLTDSIKKLIKGFFSLFQKNVEQGTGVVVNTAENINDSLQTTIDSLENTGLNLNPIVFDTTGNNPKKLINPSPGSGN